MQDSLQQQQSLHRPLLPLEGWIRSCTQVTTHECYSTDFTTTHRNDEMYIKLSTVEWLLPERERAEWEEA